MNRFLGLFLLILVSLFTLEMQTGVQHNVIVPFTTMLAKVSAAIITPFDNSVMAYGKVLQFGPDGFAVSIEAGCNGVEAAIVLSAAILAFPAPARSKLIALLIGFFAIQIANIVRIISLFYLGAWNIELFTWVHLYLWPVLIMIDVLVVFLLYLRHLSGKSEHEPGPA